MKTFFVLLFVLSVFVPIAFGQSLAESGNNGGASLGARVVAKKPADTASYPYDAGRIRYLAGKEDTGGQVSFVEITELAGYKTPVHRHPHMDEAFYVLEGVLTARIGNKTEEFGPGSFVLIPRGTAHAQGNFGKTPVRLLATALPGGFEQFFEDRVELFKKFKPGDAEFEKRMRTAIEKNHIEIIGPWEP